MTPDRAPTRDELATAIKLGLIAGNAGRPVGLRHFPDDGSVWNTAMRDAWIDGWADAAMAHLTLE